jgi:preprotein translocase subunit SecD
MRSTGFVFLMMMMLAVTLLAQTSQLSIRAASEEVVQGWQRMEVENSNRVVWVSPTAALTGSDIESAKPETSPTGNNRVAVVFTNAGAQKIKDLSTAQMNKLVALVVGDKVVWAPVVKSEIGKASVLTGNGPNGLTPAQVERIMASLKK